MKDLYSVLREGSCATQRIIVGFSGGKDSVAMLDLCKEYFKDVYAFNMYFVDKLQLQEGYFRYIEDKYQIKILRLPHFELSRIYQTQDSMHRSFELDKVPTIYFSDVENYVRDFFKCKWIAYGMMACESIERNAMLKNNNGCDYEYAKLYPLAFWNNQKVYAYLKTKNIHLPPEYYLSARSANNPFIDFTQILLKTCYPSDWERVLYKFPLAETVYKKHIFNSRGGSKMGSQNEKKSNESKPELTKYQIFTPMRVKRSELHEAEYNPRFITKENRKKLKQSVREGLADAIVWNKRTGNVVGGHQRLSVLDELERKKDYEMDVLAIDVDEQTEKKLNIKLNNPNMQGEYDLRVLAEVLIDDNIAIQEVGFTQADAEVMFNETELANLTGYEQPQEVKEDIETIKKMKEMRKTAMKKYKQLESTEYYKILVFESTENLEKFMEHFGLYGRNKESRYLSGEDVASKLGLDLPMHMKDEWGVDMGEVPGTETGTTDHADDTEGR